MTLALLIGLAPAAPSAAAHQRQPAATPGPAPAAPAGVQVLASDDTGIEIVLQTPPISVSEAAPFVSVSLPGFGHLSEPGWPALPQRSLLLALPSAATPRVRTVQADWRTLPGSFKPAPAAAYSSRRISGLGNLPAAEDLAGALHPDPSAYSPLAQPWPAQTAVLGAEAWLRGLRVVPLSLRPVRWDPADGALQVADRLLVRVDFVRPAAEANLSQPAADPWFDNLLQGAVLNFGSARQWKQPRPAQEVRSAADPWIPAAGQPWWKVGVVEDGLYALTPADLAQAGVDLNQVDPRRLQLWDDGREIALLYLGDETDGVFDGADKLVWYGRHAGTRYTAENIYWLTAAQSPGLRAAHISGEPTAAPVVAQYPATLHLESNTNYVYDAPRYEVAERWYGSRLSAGVSSQITVDAAVTDLGSGPAQLTVRMLGYSYQSQVTPDHHVRVWVNGQLAGDLWWDGASLITQTMTLDASALLAGSNAILLEAPGDTGAASDVSYVDWVDLRYPRRFALTAGGLFWDDQVGGPSTYEISGLGQPSALAVDNTDPWQLQVIDSVQISPEGSQWMARFSRNTPDGRQQALATLDQLRSPQRLERDTPGDWAAGTTGADYLVISHSSFITAVQPLLAWRAAEGMRTAVVDVQEIYDAYSDGQMDSWALRDFLAEAYRAWPSPAPAFVLLVGNGHYDFQNFLRSSNPKPIYLPPLLGCWDPWLCEVASDNRLATVDGDDPLPDMMLGRLPVRSVAEASTVVSKVLQYEQAPPAGDWRRRILFVADNSRTSTGQPDPAGNFEFQSEAVIAQLPPGYPPARVYFDPYPTDDQGEPYRYRTPAQTTPAIVAALDQGQLFTNYIGHAASNVWAHEWLFIGPSRNRNDLAQVANGPRLSVHLSMACLTGNFADPTYNSLDAELLLHAAGGSVASWGATGFGVATGHDWLQQGFYQAVFQKGLARLGPATLDSKLDLYLATQSHHDLIDTYGLLGDPATRLPIGPDLQVSHTAPAGPLGPGDAFSYVAHIANTGDFPSAANQTLAIDLPPLENVSVSMDGIDAAPITLPDQWSLEALPAGGSGTLTISGRLALDVTISDLPLGAHARLVDAWGDRNLSNNQTPRAEIAAAPADLAVSWRVEQTVVAPGMPVSATLTYGNNGPALAVGGVFTLALPSGLADPTVLGAGLPSNPPAGAVLTWTAPALPAGASATVLVAGLVEPQARAADLTLAAWARLAWLDANPQNDSASQMLTTAAPDAYEPDDSADEATPLLVPDRSVAHTGHHLNDRDWFSFAARRGVIYHVRVENLTAGADTVLSLYDSDGLLRAKNDDYTPGSRWSGLDWQAPSAGTFYLMVGGWTDHAAGYGYDLSLAATYRSFAPGIGKARID